MRHLGAVGTVQHHAGVTTFELKHEKGEGKCKLEIAAKSRIVQKREGGVCAGAGHVR